MKRIFVHPDSVKLTGANVSKVYNMGKSQLQNAGLNFDTSFLDVGMKLASGDVSGYAGDMATQLTGDENAGLIIGSAIDILMSWQKGKDTKEAVQDLSQVNQMGSLVKTGADSGVDFTKGLIMDSGAVYTDLVTQSQEGAQEVVETVSETQESTENFVSENEGLSDDIKALEDEKQQIQNEIINLETERNEIEEQKISLESEIEMTKNETADLQEEFDSLSEEDKNGPKGQELLSKINGNNQAISGYNSQIDGLNQQIADIKTQINQKNSANTAKDENIHTFKDKIDENLETTKKENEELTVLTSEKINEIEQASAEIVKMYGESQQAINEVKNVLQGNFAKMDQKALIKMSTEMVKAGINGTEGGILAAAATAAGVGSVFSFGASSGMAIKYATASSDKFAGSAQRALAQAGMKIVETEFKNYMNQQINQVITATLGPEFVQIYNDTMSMIEQSKQDIADTGASTSSGTSGASSSQSGSLGSSDNDSPLKKPETSVA